MEAAARESPVCVIRVLLEKGVHKRLEDGGKAAMKTSVDEDRQKVVDLFKAYGVILDEEWAAISEPRMAFETLLIEALRLLGYVLEWKKQTRDCSHRYWKSISSEETNLQAFWLNSEYH